MRFKDSHTLTASYLSLITQATVNNLAPLLLLTFRAQWGLSLEQLTLLTTLNFSVQLVVDLLSAKAVDKIGYRPCMIAAHVLAAAGLAGLAALPAIFGSAYAGLMAAVVLYAMGGGLIEVLVSPIVEACPTPRKEAAMSLLHSFYCWGHLAVVLLSTLFFRMAGVERWPVLACLWALLPLGNALLFSRVPIRRIAQGEKPLSIRGLMKQKV